MAECDCLTTSFFPPPFYNMPQPVTPITLPTITAVTDTAAATAVLVLPYDYVSWVCGTGNGIDICGSRTPVFSKDGITLDLTTPSTAVTPGTHPFLSYDPVTRTFSAQSFSLADVGTHVIDVTYKLDAYASLSPTTTTVTVVIANPCMTTMLTDVTQMITTSALSQASITFPTPLQDTASGLNGGDGYSLCGDRVYTLTTP